MIKKRRKINIIKKDPYTDPKLDKRRYSQVSGGGIDLVKMDLELYKGVRKKIYQTPGKKTRDDNKPYYSVWLNKASFKRHGHEWM